jgi:hypothetical protein
MRQSKACRRAAPRPSIAQCSQCATRSSACRGTAGAQPNRTAEPVYGIVGLRPRATAHTGHRPSRSASMDLRENGAQACDLGSLSSRRLGERFDRADQVGRGELDPIPILGPAASTWPPRRREHVRCRPSATSVTSATLPRSRRRRRRRRGGRAACSRLGRGLRFLIAAPSSRRRLSLVGHVDHRVEHASRFFGLLSHGNAQDSVSHTTSEPCQHSQHYRKVRPDAARSPSGCRRRAIAHGWVRPQVGKHHGDRLAKSRPG